MSIKVWRRLFIGGLVLGMLLVSTEVLPVAAQTADQSVVGETATPTPNPIFQQTATPTPVRPEIQDVRPAGAIAANQSVNILGKAEKGGMVEVIVDGEVAERVSANAQGFWQVTLVFTEPGAHEVRARLLMDRYVLWDWHPVIVQVITPPTDTPTVTPTVTPTATGTPRPTGTNTAIPTDAPTATAKATLTPTPEAAMCEVVTDQLNLRQGPGVAYSIRGSLPLGAELLPLARNADASWLQVEVSSTGAVGWVSAAPQYINCNVAAASLPIGAAPPIPTPVPQPPTPTQTFTPVLIPTFTIAPAPTLIPPPTNTNTPEPPPTKPPRFSD